jgi:hypothetical protein
LSEALSARSTDRNFETNGYRRAAGASNSGALLAR